MKDKKQIINELEEAIDHTDMAAIENSLFQLSSVELKPIQAENTRLFAARIQKINKERLHMNSSRFVLRATIAAAVAALMGLTVYAAVHYQIFSFGSDDKFVTMRTNQNITQQEAQAMVEEGEKTATSEGESAQSITPESLEFDTLEQAEQQMNMKLILPAAMPQMNLESISGSRFYYDNESGESTVWISFIDDKDRMMGVTIVREILPQGKDFTSYTLSDMDEGSMGTYKSKSGLTYTTLSESDDSGENTAYIATVTVGEYEYALVFVGFNETEQQQIIDSADLSSYKST